MNALPTGELRGVKGMQLKRRRGALLAGMVLGLLLCHGAREDARSEPAGSAHKTSTDSTCNRPGFRTVIDVGHSAEVPGAMSARGRTEYAFNLRLARLIEQKLVAAGFERTTLLITSGRKMKSLNQRVARANKLSADLFLSIHHDSVPDSFLEKWEFEGRKRGFSDRFKGHSIYVSNHNVDFRTSLLFARLLGIQLKERGLQYTHHYTEKFMGRHQRQLVDAEAGVYRYDQLIVLKDTRVPAALLEAGSIINRDEELAAASPERQALISAAVVDAVDAFCAMRRPVRPPQGARRPTVSASAHSAPAAAKPAPQPASAFSLPSLFSGKRSQ
jgi:N-acetylmuramoyl-L-alanine amidase